MSKKLPAQPEEQTIIWDLSPPRWRRTRFVQRLRHWLGCCEGSGMVQGPECRYCFADLCSKVEARRVAVAEGGKAR
jgi:hypothetical protein